jgi:hypothetical protein
MRPYQFGVGAKRRRTLGRVQHSQTTARPRPDVPQPPTRGEARNDDIDRRREFRFGRNQRLKRTPVRSD